MFALVAVVCGVTRHSQADESNAPVEVTYAMGAYTKYLGAWSGQVYDDRPSLQGDIGAAFANGIYLDVWFAKQVGPVHGVPGNEMDFIVGWAGEVLALSIDTALAYYELEPNFDGRKDNAWAPAIKVSKTCGEDALSIAPFVRMEVVIPDSGSSYGDGMFLTGGVEAKLALLEPLSLATASYFTFDSGAYGCDQNVIFGQTAALQVAAGAWTLSLPSFLLTTPLESDAIRQTETCFGVAAESKF
jgi:hypothetical protein